MTARRSGPLGSDATIGILGGGQLGRMLALAAARLGFKCHIFCPDSHSPAFDVVLPDPIPFKGEVLTKISEFWFSKTDSSLSFSDKIATTKMACPGYNEPAFMKSLKNATHYRLNNGVLTLLGDDRTELSRWMRKPASAPKALKA